MAATAPYIRGSTRRCGKSAIFLGGTKMLFTISALRSSTLRPAFAAPAFVAVSFLSLISACTFPLPPGWACYVGATQCSTQVFSGHSIEERCVEIMDSNYVPRGSVWVPSGVCVNPTDGGPDQSQCGGATCKPLTSGATDFWCICG